MSHLDIAEIKRFCKEKFIFTFNIVLTLFILLYVSLQKINNRSKQTSNTLRMYMIVYYDLILVVHSIITFCHDLVYSSVA